jgi:hypothetical protein
MLAMNDTATATATALQLLEMLPQLVVLSSDCTSFRFANSRFARSKLVTKMRMLIHSSFNYYVFL